MRTQPVTCHKTCRICGVMQNRVGRLLACLQFPAEIPVLESEEEFLKSKAQQI